jgi:hypothetical protein
MKEHLSNNKNNKNYKPKNILILILIISACIIYSFSVWADEEQLQTSPSLQQISKIIDSYPDISFFKADRLLKEVEKAVQFGISLEDAREIIQKSSEKKIKAYTIIGIFSLLNELAENGLPTSPIINKAKEGLAKGVSSNEINLNIKEESKNLQFAKYLVEQSLLEGADIENKGEAIEILASSLPYNYQEDMITDIVKKGILNQKDVKEIAGALTALSNLINLDMSITSAKVITEDLLREDYSPRDMMILVNVIDNAKKKGLSVSEINSEIIHRIREGEDALSIEKKVVDYLNDKEMAAKEDKPSSVTTTPSVGEEAVTPTQTTPEPPSEEVHPPEEPSSDEEVATPTQTGGPDAP